MHYKKQHVITAAYLKEWCDPHTPIGQEPYVWRVSRDGQTMDNKAPKNIFSESNFYTVYDENGNRNLELEHYLHKIEDDFLFSRETIKNHKPITDHEFRSLVLFVATTFARTKLQKAEQVDIWIELLNVYQSLNIQRKLPGLYTQVEQLKRQPMPYHIANFVNITTPVLLKMNLTLMETSDEIGFITSDNPVLWLDPSLWFNSNSLSFFGLGSPFLEILFPISPNFLIQLTSSYPEKYILVDTQPQIVNEINKMVVSFSDECVIMNNNKPNPQWFEKD
jgi:hypothetical protein